MPCLDELGLALRNEPGIVRRLGPFQCRLDRLGQRAKGEARGDRARNIGPVEARVLRTAYPDRQLTPRLDTLLEQEVSVDPHDARLAAGDFEAGAEQLSPRDSRVDGVERPRNPVLRKRHDPAAEIADVDDLQRIL